MSMEDYVESLVALYWVANNADHTDAPSWQKAEMATLHCRAIEKMIKSVVGLEAWQRYTETWEIESLFRDLSTD